MPRKTLNSTWEQAAARTIAQSDTEREPGMSSAGSASSVAANLVTCAIGEEAVVSIRWPAAVNSQGTSAKK